MNRVLILVLLSLFITEANAQQKRKIKIAPPPKMDVPPPPAIEPSYKETEALAADPLKGTFVAFWTDTLYKMTDTAFTAEQWCFSPNGMGTARLSRNVLYYPKGFTKDSLTTKTRNNILPLSSETDFEDGDYTYDNKIPKTATTLIFTGKKTNKPTLFTIVWLGKGAEKKIAFLLTEDTKVRWNAGDPPAAIIAPAPH